MSSDYITDEQVVKRANAAVGLEIEKLKAMGAPVIIYDRKKQVVVRRNNDGTETEVGKRLRKGNYSERIEKKSEIVIFAGPNGSGKSTFTSLLKPSMDYINADEIKKILKCSDFEAAKLAEKQREEHLKNMEDFCFETVLSTDRNLNLLKRAKEKGYFIRCYYILTADPMINIFRVRARVEVGGHDVPDDKIISRFDKALALVHEVVGVCDICHIYDNSEDRPYRIYKKRKDRSFYDTCDDWNKEDIFYLTQDMNAEKKNLNDN